jgi:hypothetical protein
MAVKPEPKATNLAFSEPCAPILLCLLPKEPIIPSNSREIREMKRTAKHVRGTPLPPHFSHTLIVSPAEESS